MSDNIVSLSIDKGLVDKALEKRIQAEIIAAIGDPSALIGSVVSTALHMKVGSDGSAPRYSSDAKYDFIEVLCTKAIKEMAIEAVKEWVNSNKELVKKAVIKELQKTSTKNKIAAAFAIAIENSLQFKTSITCNVSVPKD